MHIKDLITEDGAPDRISTTKLWTNVAHFTATVVFINQSYQGTLDYDIWLVYLGIVGAQGAAQTLIKRFGAGAGASTPGA